MSCHDIYDDSASCHGLPDWPKTVKPCLLLFVIMDSKRRRITPNEMVLQGLQHLNSLVDMTEETQSLVFVGPEPKENEIEDLYVPLEIQPVDGGRRVEGPPTLLQHLLERVMVMALTDGPDAPATPSSGSSTAEAVEAKEPEANTNDSPTCQ